MSVGVIWPCAWLLGAVTVDHQPWDRLLRRYVRDGQVDYAGFGEERKVLGGYLAQLAEANPSQLPSREAQRAFWINAYNAAVVAAVLDHQPVASVKDVSGFFDKERHRLAGQALTLDEIERSAHRLGDWRSHMATVCASAGCPTLRSEAYVPERLEQQLAEQTRRHLADARYGLRIEGATLRLSHIFKWAAHDIVPNAPRGWLGPQLRVEDLIPVLGPYLAPEVLTRLQRERLTIQLIPYDWSLNAQSSP